MASNQTTNYQLPIWESTDNFLRTEFNENNQKIDAALGALAARPFYTPLLDVTTTAAANMVSASLEGIDLSAWHKLELRFSLPTHAISYLRFNGRADNIYYAIDLGGTYNQQTAADSFGNISWANSGGCPLEVHVHLPLYMAEWNASAQWSFLCLPSGWRWHSHGFSRADGLSWSELRTVDIAAASIPAGTRVQVWGVR